MNRRDRATLALGAVAALGLIAVLGASDPEPPPPAKEPKKAPPAFDPLPELQVTQPVVCDAVWRALDKDDQRLGSIAAKLPGLPFEMRAYVLAALKRGPEVYQGNIEWARDFDAQQKRVVLDKAQETAKQDKITGPLVGAVATAVNAVPVVGQALSAAIALGYALYRALRDVGAVPPRKGADQIRRALEGAEVYKGLTLDEIPTNLLAQDLNRKIREWVDGNEYASRLPKPPPGSTYEFAPRISDYRRALMELGAAA